MREFYDGFEKAAGLKSYWKKKGNMIISTLKGLKKNAPLASQKDVLRATDKVLSTADDYVKNKFSPDINKLIDKVQSKPIELAPDLSKLTTWKGGILPALAIGASLEAGRRGVGALSHAPGYIKKKMDKKDK